MANLARSESGPEIAVALLTGGIDKPYTFGLVTELTSKGALLDVVGSDSLDCPEYHGKPGLNFLNLRSNQQPGANIAEKVLRNLTYYAKLIRYAATAKPKIFHVLWYNKFELIDRTLLICYYKLLGKNIVLTAHNVNAGKRDCADTFLNRISLRTQYRLADHIFVHTAAGKAELCEDFGVQPARVTVIPFGINNAVPNTSISPREARQRLGIPNGKKTILFFGRITPYKGLDYLVTAFQELRRRHSDYHLVIAGRPENDSREYWSKLEEILRPDVDAGRVLLRADHIPDEETELFFKAADVLVLPYRRIYQSGVLFLGYSFGLPILASDLGSLTDEIVEGETGFVFRPEDPVAIATVIERYFDSDLFADLNGRRQKIRDSAVERHSWDVVGQMTMSVYQELLPLPLHSEPSNREPVNASFGQQGRR